MHAKPKVHLPYLDGIRGIATLAVFVFHCLGATFNYSQLPFSGLFVDLNVPKSFFLLLPFSYGWIGVPIFFVVSGFCIHLSFQRNQELGWSSFFSRRFFRIYPPYLFAFCLFFFITPLSTYYPGELSKFAQFFLHILGFHNLNEVALFSVNGSFWSIAVEAQLYAIYPLLLALTGLWGWKRGLLIIGAVELAIKSGVSISNLTDGDDLPVYLAYSPFAYWLSWSLGAYLCECYLNNRTSRLFKIRFDLLLIATIAVALSKVTMPFAFLLASLLTAVTIERLLFNRWTLPQNPLAQIAWSHLSFLGTCSYSFYLLHQPFVIAASKAHEKFLPETSMPLMAKHALCLSSYLPILLLAYLSYRWIEKPSITAGRQLEDKSEIKHAGA